MTDWEGGMSYAKSGNAKATYDMQKKKKEIDE